MSKREYLYAELHVDRAVLERFSQEMSAYYEDEEDDTVSFHVLSLLQSAFIPCCTGQLVVILTNWHQGLVYVFWRRLAQSGLNPRHSVGASCLKSSGKLPVISSYLQEWYSHHFELWVATSDQLAAARFRGGCSEGIAK